ncbi:GcrA family cell cycle regulator [Methylobacterium sp. Leaf112]|uniref:GcrA family cell cycle regulator n=1 Tax=Methylobacterium sp. Leaf112 TaxID=1736258 RepID=UPI0006FAABD4|nr:GcrA family cell cycle regulator [Methylobacterium sp. Leaf112]KQP62141.1 hypothetical protein ASF52_05645 [Methylobacterium sp. Leaf112]
MTRKIPLAPGVLPKGHWSPEAVEMAVSLWPTTPSAADVAEALNARFGLAISRKAVIAKMHRLGLSFRGPALPKMLPSGTKGKTRPKRDPAVKPKPKPVPAPAPVPKAVAPVPPAPRPSHLPESRRVAIEDLRYGECKFIANDPRIDASCCGHSTELGSSRCPAHARLCTTVYRRKIPDSFSVGFVPHRRAA